MRQHRNYRSESNHTRRHRERTRDSDIHQCLICRKYHPLKFCRKFLNMDTRRRKMVVEKLGYCLNCLARSHKIMSCTSLATCKICDKLHHTLLHASQQRHRPLPSLKTQHLRNQRTLREHKSNVITPNTKILSEAIRSLAQILCASDVPNSFA
ncbi:uncharacterized protein LOC119608827 isoform X2 [Lucilia sericata]|nr:uncharacterized protein LOC119608827 isoform X2 [Lucilia sericata]